MGSNSELLKTLLAEQAEVIQLGLAFLNPRESQFYTLGPDLKRIQAAVGMRRVGKTFCLFEKIADLIQTHEIPMYKILYLNFEDDRLLPCSQGDLASLLEAFYAIYPQNYEEKCYFFLDEIQNVENWSLVIRRFFDTKNIEIYLSGSSAKLLSKEIATELRGRCMKTEVWPYSFTEYLKYSRNPLIKNIKTGLFSQKNKDILYAILKTYLHQGGFPEVLNANNLDRKRILQDYVEVVILRDVVERHEIKNIKLIKYLIKTLLKNRGAGFSVNKFYNDTKSQNISVSKNLLYDYMDYLEDAYLIFSVPMYNESLRKTQVNPKKVYAVDPGLAEAYSFSVNDNYGHLFENLVFLDLKRQGHEIYYYETKEGHEVDFFVEHPETGQKLYQVAWDLSDPKTLAREERALEAAKAELNIPGEIISPENYIEKIFKTL
ncbi:MAG: ATP-binding protein [Gammaproteobacteria bacterium]